MVDESGHTQIVRQVRDKEFDREIKQREKDFEEMKEKIMTRKQGVRGILFLEKQRKA